LDANRDARCEAPQGRRALFTLAVRLTPLAGAPQSFPSPLPPLPPITNWSAALWVANKLSVFGKRAFSARRDFLAGHGAGEGRLKSADI
jgi:hypothetical protein